jgi:hypothetical protein
MKEGPDLGPAEAQVVRSQLGQLTPNPQPGGR